MNHKLQFSVRDFKAWAPGAESEDDWQNIFDTGTCIDPNEKADVSFLPPMKRRRLSPLARATFNLLNEMADSSGTPPMIFCSQYGEAKRTFKILSDIASAEDVSPTAFSLSVHNAIAGQASIQFDNKEPILALGSDAQGYLNAFIDALGMLNEGKKQVLLVFYEESQPEFYNTQDFAPSFPCACALLIEKSADQNIHEMHAQENTNTAQQAPQIISLIKYLMLNENQLQLGSWTLKNLNR
jgi:hypothetical protein